MLGKGAKWTGGDMNLPGGGQKINLLKQKLNELMKSGDKEQIILFTDRFVQKKSIYVKIYPFFPWSSKNLTMTFTLAIHLSLLSTYTV